MLYALIVIPAKTGIQWFIKSMSAQADMTIG